MTEETLLNIGSLASDLKRVAIFTNRSSTANAERFLKEALKWQRELDSASVSPRLRRYLKKVSQLPKEKDQDQLAEDALFYGVIFQNVVVAAKR